MSLRIYRDFEFSASHSVASLPEDHKCRRQHGHNYKVRVFLEGPLDMATGMLAGIDFDTIKKAWATLDIQVDHRHLNDTIGGNATVEHLAIWVYSQMKMLIPHVVGVSIAETDRCGAEFFE